ncbi:uncharacterized protein [Haliotis asinina]|uniref:uncharacterized protein n=1 Tax=Haliotis asinina TaxID=109174 RepID=UPI0035324552
MYFKVQIQFHSFHKERVLKTTTRPKSGTVHIAPDSNQPTTQSRGPVNPSLTEGGSSSSSSAVDGFTSAASLTPSIRDADSARSVELKHPAWIVWVDVNVPPNYGTQELVMTTTNNDTVMPCNAMNTWVTSTTLRITCRNVVNATTIILFGTDSMASKLGLIEMYVYEDCQPGRHGQECGTLCSQNCTEGLCDDVNSTCACVLGWKGDNCDGDTFNRSNKTHFPVDTSGPGINPVFAGVVGTEIAAVIVLLVVMAVLLVRRHRQHSQRTLQEDAYDDIFNDIGNAQHSLEDQSIVDYDVIDVTSNDQDKEPNRPFADGTSESICEENHCESSKRTCAANEFPCLNEKCIPNRWTCDKENDCGDNSDEADDVCGSVGESTYSQGSWWNRLGNVSLEKSGLREERSRADHEPYKRDCAKVTRTQSAAYSNDAGQPDGLTSVTCKEGEFTCDNGQCISQKWKCDGDKDCEDGSDEADCESSPTCAANTFTCLDGRCVHKTWWCDGDMDCPDYSDETNCTDACDGGEIMCLDGRDCVARSLQCDGTYDCQDGSDERNCTGEYL